MRNVHVVTKALGGETPDPKAVDFVRRGMEETARFCASRFLSLSIFFFFIFIAPLSFFFSLLPLDKLTSRNHLNKRFQTMFGSEDGLDITD